MLSTAGFSTKLPFLFQTDAQPREWKQYGNSYLINFTNSFSNKSSHLILVTKHKEAVNSPGFFLKKANTKNKNKKSTQKKQTFKGHYHLRSFPGLQEEGV